MESRAPSRSLAGDTPHTTPHEPSAWLRGAVTRRIRDVQALGLDPHAADPIIVAPLGRGCAPGDREDRTCDRCRAYTPPGPPFHVLGVQPARGLLLVVGLCDPCHDREGHR